MADFALGLAKTAVEGTLSRVQSAIDEEDKQKKAVQQDLVFITGEFQMMQCFLNVASKERAKNEVVRTWVRQLRDLAFDVEDCVEFVIHLDNDSAVPWLWRLLPSCMAPPRTRNLDMAVAELKLLKARVEEVSQRNTRYNLISDSATNPVSLAEKLATTGPSTVDILMELWEANGKHRGFCNLQKLITKEGNDLQVISLWGSAGSDIEGTQIINKAYCDPEICHVFKSRAWVKLMNPFNPDEFLKNLKTRLQASSRSCQPVDFKGKISEDDPMKQLTEQRYLVILEGVFSVVEWEIIRMYLPDNNNGSRIVVSTEQIGDAIFLTGEPYRVSVLREFSDGHYLCAFYKKGSGRRNLMGELIGLLRRPGVTSVWGTGDDKSTLVKELFYFITNGNEEILTSEGAENIWHGWVDVVHPFNLKDFYLSLMQSFLQNFTEADEDDTESVNDIQEKIESAEDDTESVQYIEEWLYRRLHGCKCLVVINGLQSTKEWQLISAVAPSDFKGYIILITNDESVATSCVDHESRTVNVNDVALHPSMQINVYLDELFWRLRHRRVISVCGAGGRTSTLLKEVYDGIKHQRVGFKEVEKFEYYVWVDAPHPFDKEEFRLRLLKEWFPDVDEDEELVKSISRACEQKCIFIINGLQSTEEWALIKPYLVEGVPKSRVILIANEESVPKHFVDHLEANNSRPLSKMQASDYYGYGDNKEASRSIFLTNRMEASDLAMPSKLCDTFDDPGVTSVWGIAGVGKSALVRSCYNFRNEPGLSAFERFAWVDVPAGPFDLVEFSRLLLLEFHRCDLEAMEAAAIGIMQGQDPIQGCREVLCRGWCLVVIDGLRSTHDWDLIETAFLSKPTTNAKIVVITTEESIAKHSVKQQADQMINIKCLEDEEAYDIFEKTIDPKELTSLKGKVDLAKLVAKCGGLPKVVCAIAEVSGSFLEHMNDDFMVKLETDPQFHSLSGLLSWMHAYFDACSDSVKPCIFYLSVFPASSNIRRGRLVRRWIAEGYSRDAPGCTARENAQKRFSELVELSIIQQATSEVICQVNGFFREYIVSRPMEDNLVFALDGRCSPNTQHTGQHLTIMTDWHRDQSVLESIDFARLRSLTIFGRWCSFFISDKMKRLRVLDLEDMIAITNDDIEQIFVKLLSLKFISLRGCTKISRLPHTLGGLRQLQTLDVRLTSIVMLPSAIIKLHKLQYIRAGTLVLPDEDWTSTSTENGDRVTSQTPAATSAELEGRDSSRTTGQSILPTSPENGTAESPEQAEMLPDLEDCDSHISSGRPTVPTSPENGIAESPQQSVTSPELGHHDRTISSGRSSAPTSPENGIVESPAQAATSPEAQLRPMLTKLPRLPKIPRVVNWSMCGSEREREAQNHNGGVQVPVGMEKLATLHTLGVVNVNASGGEAFLKQLAKLTQLLKLRVCGINKKNWPLLCSALSDEDCQLESLSVRFDEDCLDDGFQPPKTLKSLKLYGAIKKLPDTIKALVNLKKLDLEMTITRPDDMHLFLREKFPCACRLARLCIKVQGDHKVDFTSSDFGYINLPRVLKIDCSSELEVTFTRSKCLFVEVLIIQCFKGSFCRVAGIQGLNPMVQLRTLWLKGYYSEEQRQHLEELIERCFCSNLVLKLEPL